MVQLGGNLGEDGGGLNAVRVIVIRPKEKEQ